MTIIDVSQDFLGRLGDILQALSGVGAGDYSKRLRSSLPEDHPLTPLYVGLNDMISSLEAEQRRASAYQRQLEEKLATIELQRAAIRELSTPIMEVWEGVLCLPIVGVLDSLRSSEMTETLLRTMMDKKAVCAIIDITGIQVMDTATADHFIRMAKAVRLLGAECVLTGIHPNIAHTIVSMGLELSGVATHRSLRSALQHYVDRTAEAADQP